jgi:AcrR family transcriptional regulator
MRNNRDREQQIRARLLEAGRTAFSQSGLYATRVEEITALAGVAKGTFYLYCASKDHLIHAIAEQAFRELARACQESAAGATSWEDRVARIARAHLGFFDGHPDWMRILHQLRGMLKFERPEWQPLRDTLHRHVEELAALLSASPAPEAVRRDGALNLARAFFGAVSGAVSVWVACEGPNGNRQAQESLVPALVGFATAFTNPSP